MCMILQNKGRYTLQENIVDVKSTRRKRKKLDHSLAGCGKMSSNFGQQKTALATNTSNVIYILLIQSFLNKCLFMKQSLTICDDVFFPPYSGYSSLLERTSPVRSKTPTTPSTVHNSRNSHTSRSVTPTGSRAQISPRKKAAPNPHLYA